MSSISPHYYIVKLIVKYPAGIYNVEIDDFCTFLPGIFSTTFKRQVQIQSSMQKTGETGRCPFSPVPFPYVQGSLLFSDMHRAAGDVHLDHTGAVAIKQRAAAFAGRA